MDLMAARRSLIMQAAPRVLPAAYQPIDWIESDGTQWIDTGVVPTEHTSSRFKFQNKRTTGDVIFGYYVSELLSYRFFNYNNRALFDFPTNYNGAGSNHYRIQYEQDVLQNIDYEVELANAYIIVNDVWRGRNSPTTFSPLQTNNTLKLNYYDSQKISWNRWYWVKIFEEGTLIRDMVPCVRWADSKPGMYDMVSRTFYTNAGTGEFIIPQ